MTEEVSTLDIFRCPTCGRPTTATLSHCRHCSSVLSGRRQGKRAGFLERVFGITSPAAQIGCMGLLIAPFVITGFYIAEPGKNEGRSGTGLAMPPVTASERITFPHERPEKQGVEPEEAPSRVYTATVKARVCRATIAALFGRPTSIINARELASGMTRISYRRPDDNKLWKSDCVVDGNAVVWRPVDAFGSDGPGRWRNSADDETVTFTIKGRKVDLSIIYADGSSAKETYRF